MIKKQLFTDLKTNQLGEFSNAVFFSFNGYLIEINVGYGDIGSETKLKFITSTGREIIVLGNDQKNFPYSPRRTPNESSIGSLNMTLIPEKYVNAGTFKIECENADSSKKLDFIEIIYDDDTH